MAKKSHKIKTPFFDDNGKQILQQVDSTPMSAIKHFCTECYGFEGNPRDCPSVTCALWPHRGKSLAYNGPREVTMSDEQREEARLRLAKARKKGKKKGA
jgi:hypothetical protein